MKVVKFTRTYHRTLREDRSAGLYNVGETAGFPDDEANALIAEGKAVEVQTHEKEDPHDDDV